MPKFITDQRKCEEEPLTEEEQKEQAEQAKAVNKELERLNAESEQNKPEVVPKQQLELIPAETMRWSYASVPLPSQPSSG